MSHENLLDPLVQQKLGNRVQFWNGLLVYSYGKELVQSFGSFSLKRLAEIKRCPDSQEWKRIQKYLQCHSGSVDAVARM